jgi:hypothetical protein
MQTCYPPCGRKGHRQPEINLMTRSCEGLGWVQNFISLSCCLEGVQGYDENRLMVKPITMMEIWTFRSRVNAKGQPLEKINDPFMPTDSNLGDLKFEWGIRH